MPSTNPGVVQRSIGGVHTHILLEFSKEAGHGPFLYLGNALTISYSEYRDKTPVFNCGSHLIDGFSIGNKYVAGSLITVMYEVDEFANFLQQIDKDERTKQFQNVVGMREFHSYGKDDLIPFNIHCLYTNEYSGKLRETVIYDATFLNNGQVMSIDDIITENTLQYVARDISEQHSIDEVKVNHRYSAPISASAILSAYKDSSISNPISITRSSGDTV